MQFPAPAAPAFPPDQAAVTTSSLRYEDLTQDGRLMPIALPQALAGLWREVLGKHPAARAARGSGIVPILTRLTLASTRQPIRVDHPIECRSGFELAHARTGDEVSRLFVNCWSEVHGIGGSVFPPSAPGPLAVAGHMFAEHTFTRPFGPPGQRRVTRLEAPGLPAIPERRHDAPPASSAGDAPEGARWLDELAPDPAEVCFTLDQTDANQHINSLVYIRVFLDAVQRRLGLTGRSLQVRSRAVDIAYRKPCFAGDRVRAELRLFETAGDGMLGAAGHVAVAGDTAPRCYVRVLVEA